MTPCLRCVLIDDDRDFLLLESRYVADVLPKIEITAFHSSVRALTFLLNHPVDLVITDYRMPAIDGMQLTAAVRAVNQDVPILITSDGDPADVIRRGRIAGASGFLTKASFRAEAKPILERFCKHGPNS